jgi:hypothetical protein
MAAIIKQGVDMWQSINDRYNEAVAKTRAEAAEKEAEIFASTQEQLAALRESTDKQLNDRRKGFQLRERRETEDHLRELRRLEDDYLFNLADAVRARDARAIIDLQRNFNKAKDQKQESFDVSQGRGKEDYNRELADIRNGEREKRDEILRSQSEQLADVRAHEAERLAELAIKRDEDLEQLLLGTSKYFRFLFGGFCPGLGNGFVVSIVNRLPHVNALLDNGRHAFVVVLLVGF